ncbi:MAG: DUF1549 domain-containing protein [Prosthecobacter sp.]|uniref:DUF1549 domain-containing protein n=1 Tax=Prosthecobacter sp. TaxID=1965333 RepID=UPI003901122A
MKHLLCCLACLTTAFADTLEQSAARIDYALMHDYEMVLPQLQQMNCPPLPPKADDTTFLRRACIDLAGRLPRPSEVRTFLADQSPDKHAKLTDTLAGEPGAAEVRFRMLAEAFRVKDDAEVIGWLRQATAEDRPYAEIIDYMIGGGRMRHRDGGNAMRTSVETAYSILGEDIHCAMCHDHAFNSHTQQECYEFAACFADKNAVRLPNDYKYRYGKPGDVVQPAVLKLSGYRPYLPDEEDQLTQVSKWIVQGEEGRRFAMVASLRIWHSLFGMPGRTLKQSVGGVDDAPSWHDLQLDPKPGQSPRSCSTVPPRGSATWIDLGINTAGDFSQATKVLIEEFIRCGGRLGKFQRILARTNAYGRSGFDYNTNWNGCYLAPAPQIRRLPCEVIWKVVTGEFDLQIPQVPPAGHPLRMLGRGTREWTDESLTPISHELVRFMMNDKLVEKATTRRGSADDLFLELLGREASERERSAISHHAAADSDVAWALLNTTEFMFRP